MCCSTMSISFSSSSSINVNISTIINHPPPLPVPSRAQFFRRINFTAKTKTNMVRYLSSAQSTTPESSDFNSNSIEKEGSRGKDETVQAISSNEILNRLKKYGLSGILSYGLLNTAYYLTTFLVVWFYITPSPGRMGYLAAVERFFKVMAMVWAGSQVTKLIRAGGALALAPLVDRGLSWFTVKFGFRSQGKAFMTIAGLCFGLAFLMFLIVTLLWA